MAVASNKVERSNPWVLHAAPTGWHNPYDHPWSVTDGLDLDHWRWAASGSCTQMDPEEFFIERDSPQHEQALADVCAACPVQPQCLDHAITFNEHGYWAGTTIHERRALRRRR